MAVTWVRGPRCGINNCSSCFYHVSGGHRVCQNGHVQEGFEATADDGEFVEMGRRITIPRKAPDLSQSTAPSKVLHGQKALELTLGLMQDVLIAQVEWLRQKKGLSADFEKIVRRIWGGYLVLVLKPGSKRLSRRLSLRDLVVLCYFGLRCVRAPVLLFEFLRWIPLENFPYIYSHRWLDADRYEKVPLEMRRIFTGLKTPTRLSLHQRAMLMRPQLERILSFRIPGVDTHYALFRLCRELMLPPEIYVGARSLMELSSKFPRKKLWTWEDMPHACALVMATKLAYGLDGLPRVLPATRKGEQIDWRVWRDVVRKTWLYQPDPTNPDERLAMYWDENEIDSYLAWQQHVMLPPDRPNDRLLNMFALHTEAPNYASVDDETLTELCTVVHSTSAPQERVAEDPDPNAASGSHYQIYSSSREYYTPLPDITDALYEVIEKLYNIEEEDVRRIVAGFESWARLRYGKTAFWDAPHTPQEPPAKEPQSAQ